MDELIAAANQAAADDETTDEPAEVELSVEQLTAAIEVTARQIATKAAEVGAQLNPLLPLMVKLDILTEIALADGDSDEELDWARAYMDLMVQRRILTQLEGIEAQQREQALLAGTGATGGLIVPEGVRKPSRQQRRQNAREMAKRIQRGDL